ncbi:MAG TPA: sugar phosphate isomerase/epimerase [Dehalococcoidia bacterium]|nr:sugar phosphate isomerase/epimerase [Dehalococcoidia bacterium]
MPLKLPLASLSTMWGVQEQFKADMGRFMNVASQLGFSAIEVNHSMTSVQIKELRRNNSLPITGVHGPAPLKNHPGEGENRGLNLAALDDRERLIAVEDHIESIKLAAEVGAQHVVVHLGHVGTGLLPSERSLRLAYKKNNGSIPSGVKDTVLMAKKERELQAAKHLESAQRSLATLTSEADKSGVTLGIETRLHYHEIPLPDEYEVLLGIYPKNVVGYLHDVGHAEVQHRLGLTDRDAWWSIGEEFSPGKRLVGLHIHDVEGLQDHVAPGTGSVDFDWLHNQISKHNPDASITFEIDQRQSPRRLQEGLKMVKRKGIIR